MTPGRSLLDLKVRVDSLHDRERDIAFLPPVTVLEPLAKALGVDKVLSCKAELHLVPDGAAVDVSGFIRADVVQTCIASLESFETVVEEPIGVRFAPQGEIEAAAARPSDDDEEGSAGMADVPEPIVNGVMDLGSLLQEFLALGVDPYPRKPGVAFAQPEPEEPPPSPFAALARLKGDKRPQ